MTQDHALSHEATSDMTLMGKYRLIAKLGQGGMAEVFLAVAQGPVGFNKLLVVKRLKEDLAEDAGLFAMFLDEARLAARVNHPNVVQTIEVGEENGRYFLVMEYLDGQPLRQIVNRAAPQGGIPLALELRIMADVLAGLQHAHDLTDFDGRPLQIVHRDVTPHNIFVTYDGHVKLVDFGIAKARLRSAETQQGILKGKIAYMAPEQAAGREVDRRADIFSVGVMFWEALTRRRLWDGQSDVDILRVLISSASEVPSPVSVYPDVDPELNAICMRALARDPGKRFANAAEFQNALEAYLGKQESQPSNREIATFMKILFQDERTKIRTIIETHLREIASDSPAGLQLINPLVGESTSGSGSVPTNAYPQAISIRSGSEHTGSQSTVNSGTPRPAPSLNVNPFQQKRPPWLMPALFGGGVLALIGITLFVSSLKDNKDAGTSATPTASSIVEQNVRLKARATPGDARLFLDGMPLYGNPYEGTAPKDGHPHVIRAEAVGFEAKTESVLLDGDVSIDIALEKKVAPLPSVTTVVRSTPPKGPANTVAPQPTARKTITTRPVDPADAAVADAATPQPRTP